MPIARFQMPDGRIGRFEVPAGLTPDQAEQLISKQVYGEQEEPKSAGFSVKDLALAAGQGLAGGIQSLTDLAGANNVVSKKLSDIQQSAGEAMTPERQAEIARREEIKKKAQGDTWEEIKATLGGLAEAPLQTSIQALASSAPIIAGTMLAPEAAIPAAGAKISAAARALAAAKSPATGIGALMGLGGQKGQDYEAVKRELMLKGTPEPEAERLAQKAAEYSLENAPRQFASTAAGGLEGALGIESLLGRIGKAAPKVEQAVKNMPEPTWRQAITKNVLEEALPEAVQATTGQVGTNVALTQAGVPTDLTQGVAAQALHDLLVGGGLGAVTSPAKMTELRKEFVANEAASKLEYAKQQQEAIAAEQAKIDATKEQFGVGKQPLALPAPAEIVEDQKEAPILQNPIGNLTPDELGPEVTKYVNQYRKDNGLPRLQSYSVEDIKDAMTAVNPEGEKAALDSILTAKTGYTGEQNFTAKDVENAAIEKNVATGTKGFNDFLTRTTGVNNLQEMSEPQLYAAFKALSDMPANLTGQEIVLPEGSNASRFKQEQYDRAVKYVGLTFEEGGGKPLSVDTIVDDIKEATGLETTRDARSVLDTAIKNGDLTEDKQVVYRTYKPENDQLVATYPTREKAEAAAQKQGLNVREATLTQVAPKAAPVIPSRPRAGLPQGYDITERQFKEGEEPEGYQITSEAGGKPFPTVLNKAEVQGKIDQLSADRQEIAATKLQEVMKYEDTVNQGKRELEKMEAAGDFDSDSYKLKKSRQAAKEKLLGRRIDNLYKEIEGLTAKLTSKPVGSKPVARTGYTITKDGKEVGTFPTRDAAEESILAELSDEDLNSLASDKRFGGFQNRIIAEQNRRSGKERTDEEGKPLKTKKVSEVLGKIEEEKPIPETPESKQKVQDLRKMLDKFGLGDVGLQIVKAIDNQADGSYAAKLIQLAIDAQNPIRTMRHEALHALKELGFFTPQQWKALERMAKDQWIDKYLKSKKSTLDDGTVVTRYEAYKQMGLSDADLMEEAIADAFGDFDGSKAPAGMLTALLNKMRNFFEALGNYLSGRGFQTYKDIFGQVEAGKLKASPKNVPSQENAWKASVEDVEKADKYALKNGILPYLSEGRLDLPTTVKPRFSLKTEDKFGIDPMLGIPLNKDGTVTVYYHTTKDSAVKLNASKKILAEGRSRIYLTNESNGGKILNQPGNFDQDVDGSAVLLNIDPSLLQLDDVEYQDGRKDFYVPIAQGEFFNRKMNVSSIQKSRKEGIVDTFSDADMAQRMGDAVAEYNDMSAADKKARLKQVRALLKREHNIGTLLSENGKLEKTRVGDYGLTKGDKSVASMGLGLASAQQITEKISTCPQSAICEGLCLGETSGGNFRYGGAAEEDSAGIEKSAFRAGPRMMQYLKTEALVVHPEEFAVLLNHEISMFEKWSAQETERKKNQETKKMDVIDKEIYQPAIRLNVTSDFRPKMWLPIIEAHPDTMFYDYTKVNTDAVAPNHHLTYSSTGVGQFIDGEKVFHKTNNWNSMSGRLDRGNNVAMAFSSKSALPDTVYDERTGKTYQVWDGDNYDARFLDPKPGEDGNLFKQGMIIGLRNKASTLKEKTASKETDGFFVEYDPKQDGKQVVIADQTQFGFKITAPAQFKGIPVNKLSLREAPDTPEFKAWFKDSKIVTKPTVRIEDGEKIVEAGKPKVMYHGTARDITEFKPKQANAIFVTADPNFAEDFATTSTEFMRRELWNELDIDAQNELLLDVLEAAKKAKEIDSKRYKDLKSRIDPNYGFSWISIPSDLQERVQAALDMQLPSTGNLMPVYVSAQKPFDFENDAHIEELRPAFEAELKLRDESGSLPVNAIRQGLWSIIEGPVVQAAIKRAGFDAFYVKEGGRKNLAVYQPTQLKSAIGNVGTYDATNPDIRFSVRNIEDEVSKLPNGAALNASIDRLTTKREQKGFIERLFSVFTPDSVDTLRQQWLNRYERLSTYDKRLAEQMGGAAFLADSSAESAALMSDNANAIASRACGMSGEGGVPVFKNGFTTIDPSIKGPLELLKPLAATGDPRIYQTYQFWAGAKRGSRLLATGRDHTYTPAEIAYAKSLCDVDAKGNVTGKFPEFAQVQKDWIKYNDGLIQYQIDTGVLSPERADEYRKYADYIPFYRQFEGQDTLGPKIFQSISGVTPPKKLKGIKEEQEAPLADFLETIVRNTQAAVQAGMKNMAAQRAIGVAVKLGEADRLNEQTSRPGTVTVLENGKPVSYEVADQLFIDAVKSLNLPELPFLSIFSAPANALRNLVTKDPGFMMANLMRDSLSAWVTSGAKMTPVAATISNFGKAIGGTDPAFLALKNAGVIGGYEFAQDVENSGVALGKKLRKATGTQQGFEKGLRPFNSLWEGLERGTEASDAATRMAVYNSVMERTGNEAEAIYRAMEVMNFNRKGNLAVVRILTAAVPFLNARMQGLDVFYRAAFGKNASEDAAQIQKSFWIRGAMLTALTTMYWFATHDDDEYKRQEQEVRDNNWLFPAAGIRIPTPFEVGTLFKVIPERILEYSFGTDTGKDLSESMARALISTFAFNPIPQTVLPLVEARTNYSFYTMRPIVGQGMEGVAPEYQVGPNTTQIAQSVGKTLGVSPMKIDHIVNGYTGTMGMYLVEAIDQVLSMNDASPKASKRFEQMPVIKRFALDKEAKGTVTAYYDLKNSVDQVVRTMNLMERTGQGKEMGEYIKDHVRMFGMRDYVSGVEKDMKQLREATVKIRSSSMDPDAKRDALRAINEAQNQLTSQIRYIKKTIDK